MTPTPNPVLMGVAGWFVPGAGHLLQGDLRKAVIFFVTLGAMFVAGIAFGGRLFPFEVGDPLVFLAAAAQWTLGLPRVVAGLGGFGRGDVVASTYEYGNTFLIAGGLLNALAALDAFDRAAGRQAR
jgi:hypothetical protein